jgi:hypothetical protein
LQAGASRFASVSGTCKATAMSGEEERVYEWPNRRIELYSSDVERGCCCASSWRCFCPGRNCEGAHCGVHQQLGRRSSRVPVL